LDNGTYKTSATNDFSLYNGEFKHQPDQLVHNDGNFLYFTEDGGKTPGVYAIDAEERSYAIFEAYDEKYFNDETTGLAFSPDGTKSEYTGHYHLSSSSFCLLSNCLIFQLAFALL